MLNRIKRLPSFLSLSAFVALFAIAGCGDDGGKASLNVQILPVKAVQGIAGASLEPLERAEIINFTVEGPGMKAASLAYRFHAQDGGELPRFDTGYDRQVTAELCSIKCDAEVPGDIVSRGRTVPTDMMKGDAKARDIFISPVNSLVRPHQRAEDGVSLRESQIISANRLGATVTQLDDGRLLIVGGAVKAEDATTWYMPGDIKAVYKDAEVYDPRTGEFSQLRGGGLNVGRAFHQAVKLGGPNNKDGRVLIMGGYIREDGKTKVTNTIEIYNNVTETFEVVENVLPGNGRALFTANLVGPDEGLILIVGGYCDPAPTSTDWLLYRFSGNSSGVIDHGWRGEYGEEQKLTQIRYNHTMTMVPGYKGLENIHALIIGGENSEGALKNTEVISISDNGNTIRVIPDYAGDLDLPAGARTLHSSVYWPNTGMIFVLGGFQGTKLQNATSQVEVFSVKDGHFHQSPGMFLSTARGGGSAALIDLQGIYYAGGHTGNAPAVTTDLIELSTICNEEGSSCYRTPAVVSDTVPNLEEARAGLISFFDSTRRVLLLGGFSGTPKAPSPIIYNPK